MTNKLPVKFCPQAYLANELKGTRFQNPECVHILGTRMDPEVFTGPKRATSWGNPGKGIRRVFRKLSLKHPAS